MTVMRIAALLALSATINLASADPPAIRGRITSDTGQPVQAAVRCCSTRSDLVLTTKPNNAGHYECSALPSGEYKIDVEPEAGFIPQSAGPVHYEFPHSLNVDFKLSVNLTTKTGLSITAIDTPPAVTVFGDLRIGETDVRLEVCFAKQGDRHCSSTNRFGQYQLQLAPGLYSLTVSREGRALLERPIEVDRVAFFEAFRKSDLPAGRE